VCPIAVHAQTYVRLRGVVRASLAWVNDASHTHANAQAEEKMVLCKSKHMQDNIDHVTRIKNRENFCSLSPTI